MAGGTEPENAPAWGAVAHVELAFTTATGADDLWVDYISISGSNYIANNPAGARKDSEVTLYTKAY
jgi:hypothetical protein